MNVRDPDGLTAREATMIAEDLLSLMKKDFAAGIRAWEKAPAVSWAIGKAYFEEPLDEAGRVFNPRLVGGGEAEAKAC
jgi:hypothetical protein